MDCIVDSKENFKFDLGVKGLILMSTMCLYSEIFEVKTNQNVSIIQFIKCQPLTSVCTFFILFSTHFLRY